MRIAITGHRPNKLGNDYGLTSPLIQWIKREIYMIIDHEILQFKDLTFISGMALGIDTLFAQMAIENKIPLICAIPCIGQESKWPDSSKIVYNTILAQSKEIVRVTTDEYSPKCMQKRNEWMVKNCDMLIAVWDGTHGGTANCIQYANSINKTIRYIDPKLFNK